MHLETIANPSWAGTEPWSSSQGGTKMAKGSWSAHLRQLVFSFPRVMLVRKDPREPLERMVDE